MNHVPEGLDARRTPAAEAMHTRRLAFAALTAGAVLLVIHIVAACLR